MNLLLYLCTEGIVAFLVLRQPVVGLQQLLVDVRQVLNLFCQPVVLYDQLLYLALHFKVLYLKLVDLVAQHSSSE